MRRRKLKQIGDEIVNIHLAELQHKWKLLSEANASVNAMSNVVSVKTEGGVNSLRIDLGLDFNSTYISVDSGDSVDCVDGGESIHSGDPCEYSMLEFDDTNPASVTPAPNPAPALPTVPESRGGTDIDMSIGMDKGMHMGLGESEFMDLVGLYDDDNMNHRDHMHYKECATTNANTGTGTAIHSASSNHKSKDSDSATATVNGIGSGSASASEDSDDSDDSDDIINTNIKRRNLTGSMGNSSRGSSSSNNITSNSRSVVPKCHQTSAANRNKHESDLYSTQVTYTMQPLAVPIQSVVAVVSTPPTPPYHDTSYNDYNDTNTTTSCNNNTNNMNTNNNTNTDSINSVDCVDGMDGNNVDMGVSQYYVDKMKYEHKYMDNEDNGSSGYNGHINGGHINGGYGYDGHKRELEYRNK